MRISLFCYGSSIVDTVLKSVGLALYRGFLYLFLIAMPLIISKSKFWMIRKRFLKFRRSL